MLLSNLLLIFVQGTGHEEVSVKSSSLTLSLIMEVGKLLLFSQLNLVKSNRVVNCFFVLLE